MYIVIDCGTRIAVCAVVRGTPLGRDRSPTVEHDSDVPGQQIRRPWTRFREISFV